MEKLAIFDVDYTLTKKETLVEFYKFMFKKNPKVLIYFPKILIAAFLYILKIIPLRKAKEYFISFIDGIKEEDMQIIVKEFYEKIK